MLSKLNFNTYMFFTFKTTCNSHFVSWNSFPNFLYLNPQTVRRPDHAVHRVAQVPDAADVLQDGAQHAAEVPQVHARVPALPLRLLRRLRPAQDRHRGGADGGQRQGLPDRDDRGRGGDRRERQPEEEDQADGRSLQGGQEHGVHQGLFRC